MDVKRERALQETQTGLVVYAICEINLGTQQRGVYYNGYVGLTEKPLREIDFLTYLGKRGSIRGVYRCKNQSGIIIGYMDDPEKAAKTTPNMG